MLEKDKNCIEFSMHSMMATHKPYQEDTEIAITGMAPGKSLLFTNNLFDIPCDVVVVSRRYFERLQVENEQLKKKLEEFSPVPGYREFLTALYPGEDIEKLVWATEQICCGQVSVNGWEESAKFWKKRYDDLFKLVGFSSKEEVEDYLVNEAECDTLHKAILKFIKENKYACEEWCKANSSNNSWKAAAKCNTPKELVEKLNLLRDDISGRSTVIESYKRSIEKWQKATGCLRPEDISTEALTSKCKSFEQELKILNRALQEWKEGTGCPSPSAAKTAIESGASWHHAYNEIKKANEKLADSIKAWQKATGCPSPLEAKNLIEETKNANQKLDDDTTSWRNVTGYSTPEDFVAARIKAAIPFDHTAAWQKATGCTTPERAKERIKALNERIDESEADYNHLLCTTGFESEGEIEDALDKCDHSTLRKALVDYEFDYENLLKLTGYKSEHDVRVMLNDSEQFVYESMRELINSLKRKAKFT